MTNKWHLEWTTIRLWDDNNPKSERVPQGMTLKVLSLTHPSVPGLSITPQTWDAKLDFLTTRRFHITHQPSGRRLPLGWEGFRMEDAKEQLFILREIPVDLTTRRTKELQAKIEAHLEEVAGHKNAWRYYSVHHR